MVFPSRILSRNWLIAGAAVLVTASIALVWLFGRAPARKDPRARASTGAPSRSSGKVVAGRGLAHAALRAGRFDQAFEFYRGLPEKDWQADDCFALCSALFAQDRIGLGRAALEAARRIDPKHQATVATLDAFRHRQAVSKGGERTRLQESVSLVEPLQSIPGGSPLGLLVLAVARYATSSDQEEEFFDRLRWRNLALLGRLAAPDDALKMAARLLLETGRALEARDLLAGLEKTRAPSGPTSGRPESDQEAAWLLSRAALQVGEHETADAMLAQAGDFGKSTAALIEPSPFAGSRRCGECHRTLWRAQQHASRHSQTLRFGAELKDVPLPPGPVADQADPGITHRFKRKSDREIELESSNDALIVRAIVDYAVGSGRHGITMLARDEDAIERELRISYSGLDGSWIQTRGIDFPPRQPGDHIGMGMGEKAVKQCLSCHATWFRSVEPDHEGARPPEGDDRGIGCERCHGPGLNHVKAAESGFADMAIALTSNTPLPAKLKSCVDCHSEDGTVKPSDPEFTRFQGTTFRYSRCFIASKDRFVCTTCHDPHGALETDSTRYEARCLSCHASTSREQPAANATARSSQGAVASGGKACPVNPSKNCVSCHMPKVEDPSRHARFTDHHIRVHGRVTP
jgi:hypothetical protein